MVSIELGLGEIGDQSQVIVMPRLDHKTAFDRGEVTAQLRKLLKPQKAVFHLYSDSLGKPIKKFGKIFATDVFFVDLKLTYIALLRQLGCNFSIGRTAAFEDPAYMRALESGIQDADSGSGKGPATPKVATAPRVIPGPTPFTGVQTSFSIMPSQILPPAIRKKQAEIRRRLAAIKRQPYKAKPLTVDGVRWASGVMGDLSAAGVITGATVEGQSVELKIAVPADPKWFGSGFAAELARQPVEFILRRDTSGRELMVEGRYALQDIYFTELGATWEEMLQQRGVASAVVPIDAADAAKGQIVLHVALVKATWQGNAPPCRANVTYLANDRGLAGTELIRTPTTRFDRSWNAELSARLEPMLAGQELEVALFTCPDGSFYTELGQKKAYKMLVPNKSTGLPEILEKLAGPER